MADKLLAKHFGDSLVDLQLLGRRLVELGHVDPTDVRLTVAARRELAEKLTAAGYSEREVALLTGSARRTIRRDLGRDGPDETENNEYNQSDVGQNGPVDKAQAKKEKKDALIAANAKLKAMTGAPVIKRRYGTVIIDPPWDMERIERKLRPNEFAFDYPTMTDEEIGEFPVSEIAEDACHLFCWTTQKHLPTGLELIEKWGFKYVFLMTWHKPGGFQPFGLPQYNSEFVIYGRRGAAKFCDTQAFHACFQAERREHSRKPDIFYETVRRVTDDGRIDIFSREKRAGFDQLGNESEKFGGNDAAEARASL
jgi:N6-adenosine-specific RNA methylase IME4